MFAAFECNSECLMNDSVVLDSRLATIIFVASAVALLPGAALGVNVWPAGPLIEAAVSGSAKDLFLAFHGYSLVLAVLFWGSRPNRRLAAVVFAAWIVVTPVLYWALGDSLKFDWTNGEGVPANMLLATSLAIPAGAGLVWRTVRTVSAVDDPAFEQRLRWLVVLTALFMIAPQPALSLTSTFHPFTFDLVALRFDHLAGLGITPWLHERIEAIPVLPPMLKMAYGMTPLAFLAVALLHLRRRPAHVASALLAWVGLTTSALIAYNLFPLTGPKYLFGSTDFIAKLRDAASLPLDLVLVQPFPRNGMPSMHFGWCFAASILWWRSGTAAWSRAVLIAMTMLTGAATLYLGEHYVIDLIVAVPFVLAALAMCSTGVLWSARVGTVTAGFATWLAWVLLLRHGIASFVAHPWLCQLLLLATVVVVIQQARWMARFPRMLRPAQATLAPAAIAAQQDGRRLLMRYGLMFFVSGMAALVYQVLFAKELALVFGSTATATFTVLATFLGGMAIGSLIGGLLAHRLPRPLLAYAGVEVGIGVYCVATPLLFQAVQSGYVAAASGLPPDAPMLLVLRVVLGAVVLLVPTVLMGTTLPLLAHAIGPQAGRIGSRVAWLYFANTAGAALGALLTAYFVIPVLGAHRTTLVAALLNLMVALGALELAKTVIGQSPAQSSAPDESAVAASGGQPSAAARLRWAALLALGLGGVLSLGLEVVYVHMLSIVAGNSIYAFGLMVATFLLGLSLGGEAARRLLPFHRSEPAFALVLSLLGLCVSVALGSLFWNSIPDYFGSFAQYPAARSFGSREVIRGLVCSLVMIPPTLFIGASYVFAMDIVTTAGDRTNAVALGVGAAVNTLGNIAGVLLFGFVLLPAIGGLESGRVVSVAAFALAALVAVLAVRLSRRAVGVATAALLVLGGTSQASLDYDGLSSGANVYFYPQHWGNVVDHAESIDGGLTTVTRTDSPQGRVHTLLTNGKFQGNDAAGGEMQAQIGFAMAPLLHQERRDRALVIGYGTGVTSRVFHEAGFREVEIAELSRDIVRLADQHFADVNRLASQARGVRLHITDGRNLLLLTPNRYDVVSLEITSIWFAGAASLYNQEFYQLARSKMNPDGVLQQWMQLHRLSPIDLLQIVASIRSEFKYVSLYVMGGQGILVATNAAEHAAPTPQALQALNQAPQLADARRIVGRGAESLSGDRFLTAQGIDRFLVEMGVEPKFWVSTDDNLRLEYDTPKANVNDPAKSYSANMAMLERFHQDKFSQDSPLAMGPPTGQ